MMSNGMSLRLGEGIQVKKHRWLRIHAVVTAVASYFMLLIGAIVTKTGSGKGCGNSWPFCHGQLIPESLPMETVIEYSHRVVSGFVGALILILAVWAWRAFSQSKKVKVLSFMSLFFVVLQGALGALTVVFQGAFAKKAALSLHFGFSLISFASVVLLAIHLFQLKKGKDSEQRVAELNREKPVSRRFHLAVWGLAAYTYIVVYTGAFVRHMQAAMGCGFEFPTCGSQTFPSLSSIAGIHQLHRYAAYSLWILLLIFLIVVLRHYKDREDLSKGSCTAFILVNLQALSGILTVMTGGQVLAALVHTTIISVLFSAICYLCMQVGWRWSGNLSNDREKNTTKNEVILPS
jgi:heme a synthase